MPRKQANAQRVQINQGRSRRPRQQPYVSAPVAKSQVQKQAGSGDIRIVRREYIQPVGGVDDPIEHINDGIDVGPAAMPWARKFIELYEHYVIDNLSFEYVPACASSTPGLVAMAIDYDPADSRPVGALRFLNMKGAVSASPWQPLVMKCDLSQARRRSKYYCQVTARTAAELRQALVGRLYLMVQGNDTAGFIGRLYVNYTIRFQTPQLQSGAAGDSIESGGASSWIGTSNAAPFGTEPSEGYLPATVVTSGSTANTTTWTFTSAWEGYVDIETEGADLTTPADSSSTADVVAVWGRDNNTYTYRRFYVTAEAGETLAILIANTSISQNIAYFVQGPALTVL